jgi:hypothetical protein
MSEPNAYSTPSTYDAGNPKSDSRIHWGAVIAGIFAAMAAMALLSVLGLAVGLTAAEVRGYGGYAWGSGAWGVAVALISFCFGGWFAARVAGVHLDRNATLNGAMVWIVAIPLMLLFYSGTIGVANYHRTDAAVTASDRYDSAITSSDRAPMTADPAKLAWGTLIAMLLGLGAAALGGYLATGTIHFNLNVHRNPHPFGGTSASYGSGYVPPSNPTGTNPPGPVI